MATFYNTCNGNHGSHYTQILTVNIGSQEIGNNRTWIEVIYSRSRESSSYYNYGYDNPSRIYIDGGEVAYNNPQSSHNVNETQTLCTWSGWIYHNNNGTKGITVSADFSSSSSNLSGGSVSGWVDLPTINRYPVLNSGSNFNDEGNPVYNITSYNTFPIRIKLEAGGNAQLITRDVPASTSGNYTLQLTEAERNTLRALTPNSNTLSVTETVCAMSGNTELSASCKNYTMTIINANPIFSNFEYDDINPTTLALTGNSKYNVDGYSTIQVRIPVADKAIAQKGASMVKYRFGIRNITYSDDQEVSANRPRFIMGIYHVYAIDSRNNSTQVTKFAERDIQYVEPAFDTQNCSIERDASGVGKNVKLNYSGTLWNNSFGAVNNSIVSATYKFKKTTEGENDWVTGTTNIIPTINGNNFSFQGLIKSDNPDYTFDLSSSYNLQVTVTDKLNTIVLDLIINSAIPNIAFADNGVGIMGAYDENEGGLLQVGGKNITGKVLWENSSPTSGFGETTITLSSDKYSILVWYFIYNNSAGQKAGMAVVVPKGYSPMLSMIGYGSANTVRRIVDYVNDTTYTTREAYWNTSKDNNYGIPLVVIGF